MLMRTVEVDVVDRFLAAVLAGSMSGADDLWTERTVLDATVPNWRFRCVGARAVSAEYATWFADPGWLRVAPQMADSPGRGGGVHLDVEPARRAIRRSSRPLVDD